MPPCVPWMGSEAMAKAKQRCSKLMRPGDLIEAAALGRGLVIYLEEGEPVVAFVLNPELVLCDREESKIIGHIDEL